MNAPDLTNHTTTQGCPFVRAVEALGTMEPTGPLERLLAGLLLLLATGGCRARRGTGAGD